MRYCIKNNKNIYLKLNETGTPVTCVESVKGEFEYSKAMNILSNLPKTMRKFRFKVHAIPDITSKKEVVVNKKIEEKEEYVASEDITRWIDKFGLCADILDEAKKRADELINELHRADKELLDILHIIEIERPKDLYNGWQLYRKVRNNRKERRSIKDELLIVENVLREIKPSSFQRERVQKAIEGLSKRKYTFRIVDEENVRNE